MLWLALHLPALSLEALQQGVWTSAPLTLEAQSPARPSQEPQPVAVLAQRRVVQCDLAAHDLGVRPGMSLAAARSLCGALQLLERDPLREAALMERLALSLSHYTPSVVLRRQGVLLEVRSSCRLFGGSQALFDAAKTTVRQIGVQSAAWGAARTAEASWILACVCGHLQDDRNPSHWHRGSHPNRPTQARIQQRLEALPWHAALAVWGHDGDPNKGAPDPSEVQSLASLLEGLGCKTLADVRTLPREGLKRRGGAWLLERMDQAFGDSPQVHVWWAPPPRFETWLSLMHRIDHAQSLLFLVQRLTEPLQGWLTRRGLAATQLALKLRHETSLRRQPLADTTLDFRFGDPLRDAQAIGALLRERLLRLKLESPVYAVGLEIRAAQLHGGTPTAFWRHGHGSDPGEAAARLRAMVDRLMVRLGAPQVQRAFLQDDHRPEHAQRWGHPYLQKSTDSVPPILSASSGCALRPTALLTQPEPLDEQAGQPWRHGVPLALLSSPERVEAGWFDDQPVQRDYHVATALGGELAHQWLWVFRDHQAGRWYLHGWFG